MPELPEVETVRRGLEQAVCNRTILSVEVRTSQLRYPIDVAKLKSCISGQTIVDIDRRAKYLLFTLKNGCVLISHLGMSGRFLILTDHSEMDAHDHVVFLLDHDEQLRFRDPRRFGMIDVWQKSQLNSYHRFKHLGHEPFSKEFGINYCHTKTKGSIRPIKNLLLDASFVVGIGNIYANEILFRAKIHPFRKSNSLSSDEWSRLIQSIEHVLHEALEQGGTTLRDEGFRNVLGIGGQFQVRLCVYGKEGEPCTNCGKKIVRLQQGGRSSFVCDSCQN